MGLLPQMRIKKTAHLVIQWLASRHTKKTSEQSKRVAVSAKDDFKNNVFGEHHGQHHCSSHLALGAAPPSHAGPVTATGFLRSAKIGDPKANVAQAARQLVFVSKAAINFAAAY